MKLKKSEIISIYDALAFLQRCVLTAKGSYAVNKNIRLIFPFVQDIQSAQKLLIDEVPEEQKEPSGNGIKIKDESIDSEESKTFRTANLDFLETEDEIELHKFNGSELRPEENQIPSSILNQLYPILNEE